RPAEEDVEVPLPARLAEHVEPRAEELDQFQLAEEGRELVLGVLPDQGACVADDPPGLGVAAVGAEVAQQPGAEAVRLADVDDPAAGVEHSVDAGPAGG